MVKKSVYNKNTRMNSVGNMVQEGGVFVYKQKCTVLRVLVSLNKLNLSVFETSRSRVGEREEFS